MCALLSHITVDFTNEIYDGTYNLCEKEKYAFIILSEYSIIFPTSLGNH